MSNILENIDQYLYNKFKRGEISREKLEKLTDSYRKAYQEEAIQAAIRDYKNPNYKGPNVLIKRREGTHEDFGGAVGGIDTSTGVFGQTPNIVAGQENPTKIASRHKNGSQKKAMRNYKYSKLRGKKVDNINEETNMKEIVKVLLQEGIDEETIHEVLDIIEGGPEVPQFEEDPKEIEKRKDDEFLRQAKAQRYANQALHNLQRVVQGKKPRRPVMIEN